MVEVWPVNSLEVTDTLSKQTCWKNILWEEVVVET